MAILTSGSASKTSAHWYSEDGQPAHRLPKAGGDGDRAVTIADAKRLHLFPSVTGILGILDKPQLNSWKVEQALRAALLNPKQQTEPVEFWMERVRDSSWDQVESAADYGTRIHGGLELALDGKPFPEDLRPCIQPVLDWVAKTGLAVTHRELRLVNLRHGYAGTTDLLFTYGKSGIGILDWKTKKTEPGKKVDSYFEHKAQLAAYAAAFYGEERLDEVLAANLFISSTEPGRLEIVKAGLLRPYFEAFLSCCQIWRLLKGYDPRKESAT
jgi:hypothetical protein